MRRIKNVHLIGVGGTGMGGIAEVLHNIGYKVSGSDISNNQMVNHLKDIGIVVFNSHKKENVIGADVVVSSTAIDKDNEELQAAIENNITIVPRAQMLAELMRFKHGIAIAGTHGKTTTTSLVASLFGQEGLDPTFVIGGKLNSLGSNAKLGAGDYFVAEADESDSTFLYLSPLIAVVTNIDQDHLETYGNDFGVLKKTFIDFIHRLPFYGLAVLCVDNEVVREIVPLISRPKVTYGFHDADYIAIDLNQDKFSTSFVVKRPNNCDLVIKLNLPGKHNVLNALAAIAVATEEGLSDDAILKGLESFQGIGRRFQKLGDIKVGNDNVMLIDDYGHHPKELAVVCDAMRQGWQDKKIFMVFQPHRYTRTKALFEDFVEVLSSVDKLILLEVYSAGEQPIIGADSRALCGSIRARGKEPIFVADHNNLLDVIKENIQEGDILLMQGAGNIGALSHKIADQLTSAKLNIMKAS